MFKIGEFSKLNKVSINTLRYYDEIGLLKPIKTDIESGYRYYSAKQLPKLNKIIGLKDLGFSLNEILRIINNNANKEIILNMLDQREKEITSTMKGEQIKLSKLHYIIKNLKYEEGVTMLNSNVIIKEIEPLKVISHRKIINDYSCQHNLWISLKKFINENNLKVSSPWLSIYHDEGFKEKNVDIEVSVNLISNTTGNTEFIVKQLEPIKKMACIIHKGSYETLSESYSILQNWIEDNGYIIFGNNRELYFEGEWSTKSIDEYITEIQIPINKKL
ncbi:MerR family transcriptional regulator [Clostridium rectalis]|uniref:MerR family transcriptional regulator n=1 Tax=Clostridium rectalis TaxID=2040295 RepID=UPI000F642EAD|nr:GyrI-like domain-containing protein [Clostridium rectalis]